jgi:hypothetical protein
MATRDRAAGGRSADEDTLRWVLPFAAGTRHGNALRQSARSGSARKRARHTREQDTRAQIICDAVHVRRQRQRAAGRHFQSHGRDNRSFQHRMSLLCAHRRRVRRRACRARTRTAMHTTPAALRRRYCACESEMQSPPSVPGPRPGVCAALKDVVEGTTGARSRSRLTPCSYLRNRSRQTGVTGRCMPAVIAAACCGSCAASGAQRGGAGGGSDTRTRAGSRPRPPHSPLPPGPCSAGVPPPPRGASNSHHPVTALHCHTYTSRL